MVLSNFLQSFSGTLNGIFIGQMLGTHALAAVSGMFPIFFFFISLVIGLGAGASVLIGQAWGAREPGKVKAIAGAALALGALIGVVAALLGSVFAREGMQLLGTPADVLDDATAYTRVMMLLMPLLLLVILYTQLLRGVSDTVTPLLALLLSTGLGLVLTPALIKGWLGLPPMGIQSAALAGFVSQAA
ncbi:MAG: MATE family efflux transporter, partial [Hydrogenophaga sp.]|nr:MATE family efflux transporter [Hydrogenophaga sp.]